MNDLILDPSEKTPYLKLLSSGQMRFGGVSMPEDAAAFYFRIIDWIGDYHRAPNKDTFITVSFRYLNSSSSSMMLRIFRKLKQLQASGKTNVNCVWYYEEDDLDMRDYIDEVVKQTSNISYSVLPIDRIPDKIDSDDMPLPLKN